MNRIGSDAFRQVSDAIKVMDLHDVQMIMAVCAITVIERCEGTRGCSAALSYVPEKIAIISAVGPTADFVSNRWASAWRQELELTR